MYPEIYKTCPGAKVLQITREYTTLTKE